MIHFVRLRCKGIVGLVINVDSKIIEFFDLLTKHVFYSLHGLECMNCHKFCLHPNQTEDQHQGKLKNLYKKCFFAL